VNATGSRRISRSSASLLLSAFGADECREESQAHLPLAEGFAPLHEHGKGVDSVNIVGD